MSYKCHGDKQNQRISAEWMYSSWEQPNSRNVYVSQEQYRYEMCYNKDISKDFACIYSYQKDNVQINEKMVIKSWIITR